jgi:SNF2 family DNA or RNA helicase
VEQVYPEETSEPTGFPSSLRLRPYQKQSLAFMLHVERHGYPGHDNSNATECTDGSHNPSAASAAASGAAGGGSSKGKMAAGPVVHSLPNADPNLRAGWLADEVGMGKTAVCAALILANPSTRPPVSDARFSRLLDEFDPSVHPVPLKLTLIIVNNTLVRQWAECVTSGFLQPTPVETLFCSSPEP